MIGIINYQRGNLNNVLRAFLKFGFETQITENPAEIQKFDGLVLPGVGAFADAMETLQKKGFDREIIRYIESGKPFLGICLGFQLLFEESQEFGLSKGLGILKGKVLQFKIKEKVPHMGWNQLQFKKQSNFLKEIQTGDSFYFVHSYYVAPEDPQIILTTTQYGIEFTSSIEWKNILACQFHPEKSQEKGLQFIKSFGDYCANHTRH